MKCQKGESIKTLHRIVTGWWCVIGLKYSCDVIGAEGGRLVGDSQSSTKSDQTSHPSQSAINAHKINHPHPRTCHCRTTTVISAGYHFSCLPDWSYNRSLNFQGTPGRCSQTRRFTVRNTTPLWPTRWRWPTSSPRPCSTRRTSECST